jgi:hypothetical protein
METKEIEVLKQETVTLTTEAKRLAAGIVDQDTYKSAADFMLKVKAEIKRRIAYFEPMKKTTRAAWQAVVDKEKEAIEPLEQADKLILNPAMSKYLTEEENKRIEAQRKADAEARRLEEESRLNAAIDAESDGQKEVAEEILNTPQPIAPSAIPQAPKVDGIHGREVWKARVVNLRELIKGVIDGKVPITAIEADMTVIGQAARSHKGELNWPGVQTWAEKTIVGRSL